jgi:hypothetical protein
MELDLDQFENTVRAATNGVMPDELPEIEPESLRGIMLTPRIAGIMLALSAKLREKK